MSKKINESLPRDKRLGQVGINNQGLEMIIIGYRQYNDIDIQFENGIVVRNKKYGHFLSGSIANPNYHYRLDCREERINEIKINNQGFKMTIIEYRNAKDIDIQFEDGTIIEHRAYNDFKRGTIAHPTEYSDDISIPNKMLRQISKQLGLNWQFEYSPRWFDNKRMDGYDNNLKIAIEMDAEYKDNHKDKRKEIDDWKDKQCLKHGIYTIRIDLMDKGRYINDKFEYIKEQILNSPLTLIYDFSNFNWELAWYNSLKNLVYEVKRLVEEEKTNEQIAEILGISRNTVINYKKQLGIKTQQEIYEENLFKTKELLQQGKNNKEIAEELNVNENTIVLYKKELGVKTQYEIKQENLQRTKELSQQGKTIKEIAEILEVNIDRIKKYKKELGIEIQTQQQRNKQERLFKTKELLQQGKTIKEIAKELNVNRATVYNYKKELNL